MSVRLAPVHIGRVLHNAIAFTPHPRVPTPTNMDELSRQAAELFHLLHARRIDYLLVGGLAMLHYVDGRNTQDIDLIMAASSLNRLPEFQVQSSDAYFARCLYHDLTIDLLLTRNPLFKSVRARHAALRTFVEREIPCATVEGLLLLKLYALPSLYRQGDYVRVNLYRSDIGSLLQGYAPDIDSILKELAPHLSASDLQEVRRIVDELANDRMDRFGAGG